MDKQQYVVYFESANYCGYGEHAVVWAKDDEEARDLVAPFADDFYYEQDWAQYEEEYGLDDDVCWASIISVELLADTEHAEFFAKDASQYHEIN